MEFTYSKFRITSLIIFSNIFHVFLQKILRASCRTSYIYIACTRDRQNSGKKSGTLVEAIIHRSVFFCIADALIRNN